MYVARLGERYIVKRMPQTGNQHAPSCPHFAPPHDASGLQALMGTAIVEDIATGAITLRLDFSLSLWPSRARPPGSCAPAGTLRTREARLSLRSLLHFVWDESGLSRWRPEFEGKRGWGMVRRRLLLAAEQKMVCGTPLLNRLFVPEAFSLDNKEKIAQRRLSQWAYASRRPGQAQQLLLMIGEVKELVAGRHGYRAIIKQVPDVAFGLDATLYKSIESRFADELALWNASDDIRLVTIAAFGLSDTGLPLIKGLYLMTVTRQWLPVETAQECQLINELVTDHRAFLKLLRYDLLGDRVIPSVLLTDQGDGASPLFPDQSPEAISVDLAQDKSTPSPRGIP